MEGNATITLYRISIFHNFTPNHGLHATKHITSGEKLHQASVGRSQEEEPFSAAEPRDTLSVSLSEPSVSSKKGHTL